MWAGRRDCVSMGVLIVLVAVANIRADPLQHRAAACAGEPIDLQCPAGSRLNLRRVELSTGRCGPGKAGCVIESYGSPRGGEEKAGCSQATLRIITSCHGENTCLVNTDELVPAAVSDQRGRKSPCGDVNHGMHINAVLEYSCVSGNTTLSNLCHVAEEMPDISGNDHSEGNVGRESNGQQKHLRAKMLGPGLLAALAETTTGKRTSTASTPPQTTTTKAHNRFRTKDHPLKPFLIGSPTEGQVAPPDNVLRTTTPSASSTEGHQRVGSENHHAKMETIIISTTCAAFGLLFIAITAAVLCKYRKHLSGRRKSSSVSITHPSWTPGNWRSRKISATNAISSPVFAYMNKDGVYCIVCYDRGHPSCQGHTNSRSNSLHGNNRNGFNFIQLSSFLEKGVTAATDSHVYSGIMTDDQLGVGVTVEREKQEEGFSPNDYSVREYLQRAYSGSGEQRSPTSRQSENSSKRSSASDIHEDIPEVINEDEYDDVLFDRQSANPIDMRPIAIDITHTRAQGEENKC